MNSQLIPTFLITQYSADDFTKWIAGSKNFMDNSNLIVIHEVNVFNMIYELFEDGAEYRLLIHPKMKGVLRNEKGEIENLDGERTLMSLRSLGIHDKIPFITRNTEIRHKCSSNDVHKIELDGHIYFDASRTEMDTFISEIPVFIKKSKSKTTTTTIQEHKKSEVDFTILTALIEDEYQSFVENMTGIDKRDCFTGKFKELHENHYNKEIALISQNKMGMVEASIKTSDTIKNHNSKMVILAGVCGGRKKKKVKLYDIIIPEQIIDIITGKYENHKFIPYGYYEKVDEDLIKYIKKIVQNPDFIKKDMNDLIPNNVKFKRENEIIQNLEIHFDTMACGAFVLKTEDFLETKSKEISDKIVGFEMESYGFARAFEFSKSNKIALVVKSVMDYTDDKKADVVDGENVKKMAAYMSYICTRALLPYLDKFLNDN